MPIKANDLLNVAVRLLLPGLQLAVNVFWLRAEDAGGDEEVDEDILEWVEELYTNVWSEISAQVVTDSIRIRNVTEGSTERVYGWPSMEEGGRVAEALPPACAGLVTAYTNAKGVRGRKFIAGLTEDRFNGIQFHNDVVSKLALFGSQWATPFLGAGSGVFFTPVVARRQGGVEEIRSIVARAEPAYQRRRRRGRGQ